MPFSIRGGNWTLILINLRLLKLLVFQDPKFQDPFDSTANRKKTYTVPKDCVVMIKKLMLP